MAKKTNKEPDFYPFRIKDHGWVLKNGASMEEIGEAFRSIVYQLVSKDFEPGSVAECMYNDAIAMMQANSDKARKAANARWGVNSQGTTEGGSQPPTGRPPGNQMGAAAKRPLRNRGPITKEEFRQFVYEQDLHIGLSEEWYDIHQSRGWVDRDGVPIKNWKGALTNYCRSRENQ